MFNPKDNVYDYTVRKLKTPEGIFLAILIASYLLAFIFYDVVESFISRHGGSLASDYRVAFLLMPLLLIILFLRMDMTARSIFDRLLTVFVLGLFGSILILLAFKVI